MKKYTVVLVSVFLAALIIALFGSAMYGCKRTKVFKIGIVSFNSGHTSVINGFKSGMTKSGYIEDKNIIYLYDNIINICDLDAVLHDMIATNVDLILADSTPAAQKAKEAVKGTHIPVIFAPVLYPVKSGLVKSLTHPEGNITGIQTGGSTAKALEWHKIAVPGTKCIYVPCKCGDEAAEQSMSELKEAAKKLGLKLEVAEVDSQNELKAALGNIPPGVDSIWLLNSPFLVSNVDSFVQAAKKYKLPLSSGTSQYNAGVMMSYGQDLFKTGEQAARLARRVLEGVPPSELPVETSEFYLGVNLRTAAALGIKIPDDVLLQASEIFR